LAAELEKENNPSNLEINNEDLSENSKFILEKDKI
jgi:hypothetical protein